MNGQPRQDDVCVRRVANGWIVTPAPRWQDHGPTVVEDVCYVFQTFTALVEHLEAVIAGPKP